MSTSSSLHNSSGFLAQLTPAQREAVEATEGPVLVIAAAGSGKTRVITRRIAHLVHLGIPPWQILALTFTNKAAGEMAERVRSLLGERDVDARGLTITTFHSLGARILRRYAEVLGIKGLDHTYSIYDADDQSALMKRVLKRLDLSSGNFPPSTMLGRISNLKNQLVTVESAQGQAGDFFARQVSRVYTAYDAALRENNAVDFDDLLMLTARLLREHPAVKAELQQRFTYLLIDEYQDTNHAQFLIASELADAGKNICVVGDPDQCLPAGTPVRTPEGLRPIEAILEGDEVVAASGWGSMATFRVEKRMVRSYHGPLVRIETESGASLRGTPNHIAFARLRPDADLHYTYLMWKRGVGYRLGVTRGVRASKDGEIVSGLQVRTNQEVADAIWIVRATSDPSEARFYEHFYSVRYGIPTMVFWVRGRRMAMGQQWVDRLYSEVDTTAGAEQLLADLGQDKRYPHHRPGAVTRESWARRLVLFTMFGDGRPHTMRPWHEHRVQLVTTGEALRRTAETAGFPCRDSNKGTWRIETSRKHFDDGQQLAEAIAALDDDIEIVPRARLTPGKAFLAMPLSHLWPGMIVPVQRDDAVVEECLVRVEREEYRGEVYDLSVADARNYCAGDIVVHNSIYAWRGADISNILDFESQYPDARVIALGQNFRSTEYILKAADELIRNNEKRKHKDLYTERQGGVLPQATLCRDEHHEAEFVLDCFQRLKEDEDLRWSDMAVFYRTNALSRVMEETLRRAGVPYLVARGTAFYQRKEVKDALAYLKTITNPLDEISLRRIINLPARGISKTTMERLDRFAIHTGTSLFEALRRVQEAPALNARAVTSVQRFLSTVLGWQQEAHNTAIVSDNGDDGAATAHRFADFVRRVLTESGIEKHYKKLAVGEEDAQRLENLHELISSAADFALLWFSAENDAGRGGEIDRQRPEQPTLLDVLRAWLEQVSLVADVDALDSEVGALSLMTLHAAKGLEFPAVAMIGLEEGLLPHGRSNESEDALEEERRLCFVGMTRAEQHLVMTCARRRTVRGVTQSSIASRFLGELPQDVVQFSDQSDIGYEFDDDADDPLDRARQEYPKGSMVRHPQFGVGRVHSCIPGGYVKIAFPTVGVKTLAIEYARLERVE